MASNSQYQYSMRNEGGSNIAATGKSSGAAAGGRDEKEETRRHRHRRERDKRRDRREKEKRERGARREARRREKDRERRAPIPAGHDELSALPPISKNSPTLKIDMAGGGGQSSKHRSNRSKNVARGSHLYGTYGYTGYNSGNYNYNGANNNNNNNNGTSYRYQHKSKYYKSGSNYGKNHSQHSYGKGSGTHGKGGAHHVGSRRYPSGKKGNFQGSGASSKFLLSQAQSGIAPAGGGSGHSHYSYGKYGYQFRRSDRSSNKYLSPYSQRALKQHMR